MSLKFNIPQNPNILITSSGSKVPLILAAKDAIKRISKNGVITAADSKSGTLSESAADDFLLLPPIKEINTSQLIQTCKKLGVNSILPTRDGELLFWATNKANFAKEGINVLISSVDSLLICLDKLVFSQFGSRNNLPFIETTLDLDLIKTKKIVVKERISSGSRKVKTNLRHKEAAEYSQQLEHPIFQPHIEGWEISIDAWFNSSEILTGFVLRTRDFVDCGEAVITTTFSNKKLESSFIKILNLFKLRGPINFQAFIDRDDNLSIIECNPRIGGASLISIKVGLDFIYWTFLESWSKKSLNVNFFRSQSDFRQIKINNRLFYESI